MAGACGVFALAATVDGGAAWMQRSNVRSALASVAGLEIGAVDADPLLGRVSLRRASLSRGDIRITAERIDVPVRAGPFGFIGRAAAAEVATTSADNIRIESGGTVVAIPHIELRGASLGKALAALSGDAGAAPGESYALTQLSLDSLAAPEITLTEPGIGGDPGSRVALHNLAISGIAEGRVAAISASGVEMTEPGPAQAGPTMLIGKLEAHDIDVGLASTIGSRVRTDPAETLRPVLGSFTIANIAVTPKTGEVFKIDAFEVAGLKGRPLTFKPKRLSALVDKPESERSEAERSELMDDIRDAAGSGSLDSFSIRTLSFEKVAAPDPVAFDLADFSVGGFTGLKVRSISATRFHLKTPEVTMGVGSYATNDLDETGLLDIMARYGQRGAAKLRGQGAVMPPWVGDTSVHDVAVSAATTDGNGNVDQGGRIEISIPLMEMSGHRADGQRASESTARVQGIYDIVSPAPGSSLDEARRNGFSHFDITSDYAVSWDEPSRVLKLDHVTMAAKDLASVTFGATVSGLSQDILARDPEAIAAFTRDLRFQAINVGLINAGLFEKALPVAARGNNTTVPELKAALKAKIGETITQTLGAGPVGEQINAAVATFIDQPKSLSLAVVAKGGGLDMDTIQNAAGPDDLLKLLNVTATANR